MAGRWVMNAQTGQLEYVEEGQTPQRWGVPPGTTQTPVAPLPSSLAFQPEPVADNGQASLGGNMLVQYGQANRGLGPAAPAGSPNASFGQETPPAPRAAPGAGTVIGNDIGGYNPYIDFSNVGIAPEDQQYIQALEAFQSSIGGGAFPDAPTFTADPAAGLMAKRAAQRDVEMQAMLDEMRSDVKERDPARRSGLQRFGEFLSALAASGRLEDAGMIWNELDQRYRQEGRDLRNEMRQITMAGFQSEDRRDAAQAGLLSAEHGAGERTAQAGYQRDIGAFQAEQGAENRRVTLGMALAEATRNAAAGQRERRTQALTGMLNIPGVSGQAANELANEAGFTDPRAQSAVSDTLVNRQRAAGLMYRIQQTDLGNSRARNELVQLLRQWNPAITTRQVQDLTPEQIFVIAVQGPSASQAFRNNPDLGVISQYQGMFAGAE